MSAKVSVGQLLFGEMTSSPLKSAALSCIHFLPRVDKLYLFRRSSSNVSFSGGISSRRTSLQRNGLTGKSAKFSNLFFFAKTVPGFLASVRIFLKLELCFFGLLLYQISSAAFASKYYTFELKILDFEIFAQFFEASI